MEDDDALTKPGIIRTIYDPTRGTGGFLSSGMEYVHELNPQAVMRAFGQELNPESYAICKADMLIKGQEVSNIKLGNTLSNDQLYADKFDYMLANPPFGVDWKKIEGDIKKENIEKGFEGRFGPGLPRVSDGSLLFLLHLLSKLRDTAEGGARIGIILNGSPLFTGGAGSGESEIRRYILEADLLEAIVALPTDMFYNTGIATYVWVLSNKKASERKGQVQLINGVHLCGKMRKSLGSKRHEMSADDIATVTKAFGAFEAIAPQALNKPAEAKSNRGRQAANTKAEPKRPSRPSSSRRTSSATAASPSSARCVSPINSATSGSTRCALRPSHSARPCNGSMANTAATGPTPKTARATVELAAHEAEIRAALKADFAELKEARSKTCSTPDCGRRKRRSLRKARDCKPSSAASSTTT